MFVKSLVPDAFYWARPANRSGEAATVVQVSTVFGKDPEYWTLAVVGSDQHHMLGDFEIISRAISPEDLVVRHAAE
ncbi:hypothetical protein ASE04_05710 [Rhizobium sp. Root708]|uniref:hypothetical protein n=1 Tax=Rhizobium sp. Root708 TaxID=1736592 RepID=UPI000701F758|nr:hypothetical protein [Rhizobium sp. Root708]KRB55382.1 hypothetical protein ASE04_05710 [Rhizobium sp. Root708]